MLQTILEYIAITCFIGLTLIGVKTQQWNYAGLNLFLTGLYVFLYIQPFK